MEAEYQARRRGAMLVNARRQVYELMGDVETKGAADDRTFVFSAIISPNTTEFWV